MGIALYAMFIGLLVPSLTRKPVIVVAAIAVLTQAVLYFGVSPFIPLSSGLSIILATIVAAGIGALVYKEDQA